MLDQFNFNGAKAMNGTLAAVAVADAGDATDLFAVDVAILTHGYVANSLIYIQGTTYYDGIRKILSLPDANSIVIAAPTGYTAETPVGTEVFFPGVSYNTDWLYYGFELHMSGAGTSVENLTITKDALAGPAFDTLILTQAMAAVTNLEDIHLDDPRPMKAGDVIKFAYANSSSVTWGLTIYARPIV